MKQISVLTLVLLSCIQGLVTGTQGASGPSGLRSVTGIQGATGTQGATGALGVTGTTGPSGLKGVTGIQGATGTQGVTGALGVTVTGPSGLKGVTGIQGATGAQVTGVQGVKGAGNQGAKGTQRASGAQGVKGVAGHQGVIALTGVAGQQGLPSVTGPEAATEAHVTTGAKGDRGGDISGKPGEGISKECSVERTRPGSRTALQADPSLQTACKRRDYGSTLSAGTFHTCALSSDGSYECIGDDAYGRSNGKKPKWPLSNPNGTKIDGAKYVQVSAGLHHTCALTSDGSYECIGNDGSGKSNGHKPKWPLSNPDGKKKDGAKYVQVSCYSHTCALTSEGSYECIGWYDNGKKSKWPLSNPNGTKIDGAKYVQVSVGVGHTCALTSEGSYECIGSDYAGQSNGRKPRWPLSNPGGKKKGGAKYVQVSAGSGHTCALTSEGSYECIGGDRDGKSNGKKPKWPLSNPDGKKKDGAKYVQVSAGSGHTCALTSDGSYECIGDDSFLQSNNRKPKWPLSNPDGKKKGGAKYVQVSVGFSHTCALTSDGSYECIGNDGSGQSNERKPKVVHLYQLNIVFSEISAGGTCALTSEGSYECIGSDYAGQSNGHKPKWPLSNPGGKKKGGAKYVQVSCYSHTCALTSEGSYECIGWDTDGKSNGKKPKWPLSNPGGKKKNGAKYVQVSAGSGHTCALVNDGSYECIGGDSKGQSNGKKPKWPLSNPDGKKKDGAKYVQVSAGDYHTCALVNDGSYECIGGDSKGQSNGKKPKWPLSNPDGKKKDGAKYVQVSAGDDHTCALTSEGSYECIGSDYAGQSNGRKPRWPLSNPGGKKKGGAKYVQVSAGSGHTCALTSEGSYECIGGDRDGKSNGKKPKWPLSNPDGKKKDGAKYVQVSAGSGHTCALVNDGSYECIGTGVYESKPVYSNQCLSGFGNDGRRTRCRTCDLDEFARGGFQSRCRPCPAGSHPTSKKDRCIIPEVEQALDVLKNKATEQLQAIHKARKEITDVRDTQGKVIHATVMSDNARRHLQRGWAENEVQAKYYDRQMARKSRQGKDCKLEAGGKKNEILVFPAVSMADEDDDVNCLNINRDRAVNAYCTFRKHFDLTLKEYAIAKTSKDFWPNLCCASIPGDCKAPHGIDQIDMIPFAGAQGVNATKNDLWQEMNDMFGPTNSYVKEGMMKALKAVKGNGKRAEKRITTMFEKIRMCGPHVFPSPTNGEMQVCQLFHSYHHMFHSFHTLVKSFLQKQEMKAFSPSRRRRLQSQMRQPTTASCVGVIEYFSCTSERVLRKHPKSRIVHMASPKSLQIPRGCKVTLYSTAHAGGQIFGSSHSVAYTAQGPAHLCTSEVMSKIAAMKVEDDIDVVEYINNRINGVNNRINGVMVHNRMKVNSLRDEFIGPKGEKGAKGERGVTGSVDLSAFKKDHQLQTEVREMRSKFQQQSNEFKTELRAQIARMDPNTATCPHMDRSIKFDDHKTLEQMQDEFCTEYNLELGDPNVMNMAIVYVDKDIGKTAAFKRALASNAKFRVTDQCTNPLFRGSDVSMQQIDGRWALIVQFNRDSGYLKHEINERCEKRNYLPRTEIGLQLYADRKECCADTSDFFECRKRGCALEEMNHHWVDQELSFKMTLTGNVFEFELYKFLLEGTQFTSPTRTNKLTLGKDVNGGDVKNSVKGTTATTSFLEMASTKDELEHFKAHATGDCAGVDASALVKHIVAKGGEFRFNCLESEELCKCITQTGQSTNSVEFSDSKYTLKLTGDGEYLRYEVEAVSRRRRLLQRGGSGRC